MADAERIAAAARAHIEVENLEVRYGSVTAVARAVDTARPLGMWQDHDTARHRRPRTADHGRDPYRRQVRLCIRPACEYAGRNARAFDGVSVLRDLAPYDGVRQCRLRAPGSPAESAGDPGQSSPGARSCAYGRLRTTPGVAALWRAATARRIGAGMRVFPVGVVV